MNSPSQPQHQPSEPFPPGSSLFPPKVFPTTSSTRQIPLHHLLNLKEDSASYTRSPSNFTCQNCSHLFPITNMHTRKEASLVRSPTELRHFLFAANLVSGGDSLRSSESPDPSSTPSNAAALGVVAYYEQHLKQEGVLNENTHNIERAMLMVEEMSQEWMDALMYSSSQAGDSLSEPTQVTLLDLPANIIHAYLDVSDSQEILWHQLGIQEAFRLLTRLRRRIAKMSGGRIKVKLTGWATWRSWASWREQGEVIERGEEEAKAAKRGMQGRKPSDAEWFWH